MILLIGKTGNRLIINMSADNGSYRLSAHTLMQVNLSLVTQVDIKINICLLSFVFLRLEVGLNRKFLGSHRLEIQNL